MTPSAAVGARDAVPALVDTHCHLDARQFTGEPLTNVLDRAWQAGVVRLVTIGTDLESSQRAAELAGAHDGVYAAVGVDPNEASTYDSRAEERLRELAGSPRVVAIGEIGLDYHWDRSPRDVQGASFRRQLELARALDLPVVIHSRDASEDTAAILEAWSADHPWCGIRPLGVMHCFDGELAWALRMRAAGFVMSFAGNVTYPHATRIQEVAEALPTDAFVMETDSPYLAPQAERGRRNEPAYVSQVAHFVASLRGVPMDEVARSTTANACRLFGWPILERVPEAC